MTTSLTGALALNQPSPAILRLGTALPGTILLPIEKAGFTPVPIP